ncbi:porphobilinogen synthase [Estrella lausannensis]|uniref:Delta-aminolevulinic acid dehydratase n=1 Tax=Estrella lausannensis TaxID=483423 RepID=A0A0H5DMS2_9BACT|nr:porphobilinogen synthase [Estrella lausannensis]CRX37451.1 Delta-aminolevulinic acid dehydratase [Estrella lausannensis]
MTQLLSKSASTQALNKLDMPSRPRRLRRSDAIRGLVQETRLHPRDLIVPLFIAPGDRRTDEITSMPGIFRLSLDHTLREIEALCTLGIRAVDLFAYVAQEMKDSRGSEALRPDNLLAESIRTIKKEFPEILVMADIALDPYTDHGHDGIVNASGDIVNDETVEVLSEMSLLAARAGVDVVAPSDMMDGRVASIRSALDQEGFEQVSILSYTAKYASSFYGPFRDALDSKPRFGNKKTYQMNPANVREALREAELDEAEGADMLLVKPALPYLDVIAKIKERTHLPVGAYHVSGEYAMVIAGERAGWIKGDDVFLESLTSIKRAGADFILTYAAKRVLPLIQ